MKLKNIFNSPEVPGEIRTFSEENLVYIRVLLLLQTLMYPLWWLTSLKYSPHLLHVDPLMGRVQVGLISLTFFVLTYLHRSIRKNSYLLMLAGCWLISFHYMAVVKMSELAPMRIFGMFQIVSCLFIALLTLKSVLAYGAYMIVLAAWVAQTPSDFPGRVLPPALALLTLIMYLSLRVRIRLIERLTKSKKDIRDILDNVPTGFIAIGRSGNIEPGFSTASTQLFGELELAGKSFPELASQGDSSQREILGEFLNVAFDDQLPFEDAAGLAPNALTSKKGDSTGTSERYVALEYHPSFGVNPKTQKKELEKIIIVATDRTREKGLEREVKLQQNRILAIAKILELRESFQTFVFSVRELAQSPPSSLVELTRALHTQKGHAQSFYLTEIAELAHQLEDVAKQGSDTHSVTAGLPAYREKLERFLTENESILGKFGDVGDEEPLVPTRGADTKALIQRALQELPPDSPTLSALLRTLYWVHPSEGVRGSATVVQSIAERQGKKIAMKIDHSSDLAIYLPPYRALFASCIHAFRNAVDHGVESPSERKAAGKSEEAIIECRFAPGERSDRFCMEISDDGRGVELERVKQVAARKGLITESQAAELSVADTLNLLFLPGFTTREEVTALSGRGVGLDAIREEAQKLGGTVILQSVPKQGTRMVFDLPLLDGLAELRATR